MLSIVVSASKIVVDRSYTRIPLLAQYVDWISVLAYDYHTGRESETGHIAPLYQPPNDISPFLNANFSVTYWIKKGVPAEMIVLGIPAYGSSFTLRESLQNQSLSGFGAKAAGPGGPGRYTKTAGFLAYYEVRDSNVVKIATILEYY